MKALALLLLFAAACTAPRTPQGADDPAAAAEAFSRAIQQGDAAAAWALLSSRTQAQADALAARARVSADAGPESGRAMLFSGAFPLGLAAAQVISTDGGSATLAVSLDAGSAREFHAVHEADGWKLELNL